MPTDQPPFISVDPWARAEIATHEVIVAARAVIARWDADDVNAGLMDRDVERLRSACDAFPAVNRG